MEALPIGQGPWEIFLKKNQMQRDVTEGGDATYQRRVRPLSVSTRVELFGEQARASAAITSCDSTTLLGCTNRRGERQQHSSSRKRGEQEGAIFTQLQDTDLDSAGHLFGTGIPRVILLL